MLKKLFLVLLLVSVFSQNSFSQHITEGKSKKLRFYLRNDFNTDDPQFYGKPLFGRFKHTYVPPEDLKEVPNKTIIMNAEGFELVNISPGNNAQSETWMAINPNDPNNLIATSNDNNYMWGDYQMSSWASTDGGRTWTHANTPPNRGLLIDKMPGKSMTIFDPGVAFDTDGTAFYAYGFTQINDNTSKPDDNGVFIAKSTNKGLSWEGNFNGDPISVVAIAKGNQIGQPFHDRYTLASDIGNTSPYKDRLYLAWQKFQGNNSAVVLSISSDKGANWTSPIPLFTGDNTQSPYPAVGPDGEVYVIWQSRNRSNHTTQGVLRSSQNGGASWNNSSVAIETYTIGEIDPDINTSRYILTKKQNIRVSSCPAIAVDCTPVGSPTRGVAYVVMAGREASNGDYGIYLTMSKDKGQTWLPKKRIDDAVLRNDMFFPSIAVDRTNGTIAIFYYSSQNDPNNVGVDAYVAVSRDGGETFKNIRLTTSSVYLNSTNTVSTQDVQGSNVYWGDYSSIVADQGKIFPLFWWPTGSTYQYGTLDLFTALISGNPKPPTDYKAISQYISEQVKIKMTWENPTHDLLGGLLGDFKLQILRNGTQIVELAKGTTEYIDADVVDGTSYLYQIRCVLPNGDASVFAEQTLFAGGAEKPLMPTEPIAKPTPTGVVVSWINPSTAVDGSDIRNLVKVNIYNDGNLVGTANKANISAGQESSLEVALSVKKFYKLKLKAVTSRNDVETESDYSEEVFSYAGELITDFIENFDVDAERIPSYTVSGNWGLSTVKSVSAPNSLNQSPGANYASNLNYKIILAPTKITEMSQSLTFDYLARIHATDNGSIYISKDFGKTFIEIMRFNSNSNDNFKGTFEESSFANISYDLRGYIGETIYLMIGLNSGPFLEDVGLFIDNIILDERVGVEERYNPIYNSLSANVSPNPSNGISSLSLDLPIAGNLSVGVYDQLGSKIATIANEYTNLGNSNYSLDLSNFAAGVYYIRVNLNSFTKTIAIVKQ